MDRDPASAYFADVDEVWDELSDAQRAVVQAVRVILSQLDLRFARPGGSTTTYDQTNTAIHLKIRHATDDTVVAILVNGDRIALHWPGGTIARPSWDQHLADVLEAMLTGHNVIRSWLHGRKVVAVDSEIWMPGRVRRALPRMKAPGVWALVLRRLPWPARRLDATLSFAREPALAPPAERDRV
jgi:hypothetical protein